MSSVMSMTTGALPVGPLEEDGWGAAGWKANLVRSMVGAEVPLARPLDEVNEAGRRRFIQLLRSPLRRTTWASTANTARCEGGKSGRLAPHGDSHRAPRALARHLGEHASFHGSTSTVILPKNPDHLDLHHLHPTRPSIHP